jgi:hypothetical protein
LSGTTCESLVHKLGCKHPQTTKELLNIATNHTSGEEAVGAIFDHARGKAKRDGDAGEGASNRSKKMNRGKQWFGDSLMATAERKGKKAPTKGASDHFEKMLEGTCPNHAYPVKHTYKDYGLMKKFLTGGSKKGDGRKKPDPQGDDAEEKEDTFLKETGCLMIFGEPVAYDSKRWQKLARRKVYAAEPATPAFIRWPRSIVTFDCSDHPNNIPHLGQYLLVVDPIIDKKCLSKVLMDGGSGLNIMYVETLDAMGINQLCI